MLSRCEKYMCKFLKYFYFLIACGVVYSCYKETPVPVHADFDIEVTDHDYSVPVRIRMENKSTGADLYAWTFEGGEPRTSNRLSPEEVVYHTAGTYTIRLEAWNTTERKVKEKIIVLDSAICATFTYAVPVNNYAPAEVVFHNHSYGGRAYHWDFGGGVPAVSAEKHPPLVVFRDPGLYVVQLKVSNTREVAEFTDTIRILPRLSVDFDWMPGEDDYDMQAPFMARLTAKCTGAVSYRWVAEGGRIGNDTLASANVIFDQPGSYSVQLCASNGKEMKCISKDITVLKNSNLYVIENLRFGITTALNRIGAYYSSEGRQVLTSGELTEESGPSVDLVFWGLQDFEQCCFLSPDAAALKALPEVPLHRHSWVINRPEYCKVSDFDAMINDDILKQLQIEENSDGDVNICFTGEEIPHCILFETWDHRKGVVKVKERVMAGKHSYVIADIKIQKEKR